MSTTAPILTAGFWRTRRAAAVAGIAFGVLLLTALTMLRFASPKTGSRRSVTTSIAAG